MEARNISVTLEAREWYIIDNICILKNTLVYTAGVTYFKREEDAKKAIEILGKDIKYLF